jgi:predicted RecA/RadA family phage recombinase
MQNYLGDGDVLSLPSAPASLVSGQGLLIGAMFGVVLASVAQGQPFMLWLKGTYQLPKNASEVWTVGEGLYWDNTGLELTTVSAGNTRVGIATAPTVNPSNVGNVRLNGSF